MTLRGNDPETGAPPSDWTSDAGSERAGEPIDVSVIVATHNRSKALVECLESIRAAALEALPLQTELLVVANACPDDTFEVACAWAETAGFPVRVIWESRQGACRARNLGIAEARGRIMAITDDDCQLAKDYVQALVAAYAKDEVPTLRGGRLELGNLDDLPMTIRTGLAHETFEPPMFPGGFLQGCNFTFPRAVVDRVGWFDTRFGPGTPVGAAEDTDYLYRAWKLGIPVVYDPTVVIYHHHGRRQTSDIYKLFRTYNRADGAFYAKHAGASPRLLRNLYWDLRNTFTEWFGGRRFNEELGLRHGPRVAHVLAGAAAFLTAGASDDPPRTKPQAKT